MATNENPCTDCAACGGCDSIDTETEGKDELSVFATDDETDSHS